MKNSLLLAFVLVFVLGIAAGCFFFILFQSYVVILAFVGLVSLLVKIPPLIDKLAPKIKR